jgi:hypothetical protein
MAIPVKYKVTLWAAAIAALGGVAAAAIETAGHPGNGCTITQSQDHNNGGTQKQGGNKC